MISPSSNKISAKEAEVFLADVDKTKIFVRSSTNFCAVNGPADLLLNGPAKSWNTSYLSDRIHRSVKELRFDFLEIAERAQNLDFNSAKCIAKYASEHSYCMLHKALFPYAQNILGEGGLLPMGLLEGTGVLLDDERIKAALSRDYCCPSYLSKIENEQLRRDIFFAMNSYDFSCPDYKCYSLNFGYARHKNSWKNFFDCVAIHEKKKNVVIVFNYKGMEGVKKAKKLFDSIFSVKRLSMLEQRGYSGIVLKTEEETIKFQPEGNEEFRSLTAIGRRYFAPQDMKWLQLSAERLLATGDNSAVEAWCSRCKLYVYEDVDEVMGCKWLFLQQQVDLAKSFSLALSNLLALFGGDKRYYDGPLNNQFDIKQMDELEVLLAAPNLEEATLRFCQHIRENYSFNKALEGAIKRCVWNQLIPALQRVETESIDRSFYESCIPLLRGKVGMDKFPAMPNLVILAERVKESVNYYFSESK